MSILLLEPSESPAVVSMLCRWLDERLTEANVAGESVIVAAHHQAGRGAARPTHLAWNWKEIRAAMVASKCVKLYLSGHDHMGGYLLDSGVHWITVEAMLEGALWMPKCCCLFLCSTSYAQL